MRYSPAIFLLLSGVLAAPSADPRTDSDESGITSRASSIQPWENMVEARFAAFNFDQKVETFKYWLRSSDSSLGWTTKMRKVLNHGYWEIVLEDKGLTNRQEGSKTRVTVTVEEMDALLHALRRGQTGTVTSTGGKVGERVKDHKEAWEKAGCAIAATIPSQNIDWPPVALKQLGSSFYPFGGEDFGVNF